MDFKDFIVAAAFLFSTNAFAANDLVTLNLGTDFTIELKYDGNAPELSSVQLDRTPFKDLVGSNELGFDVTVNGDKVFLNIDIGTGAPSFEALPLRLAIKTPAGNEVIQEVGSLTVKAIYEIQLLGGNPEKWSSEKKTSFVSHRAGLRIRYVNHDAQEHRVHSQGAIDHQPDSLEPANQGIPVGSYQAVITPDKGYTTSLYYCHEHENSNVGRTLEFNVDLKK